jgi:uncharacterized membrane protein YkvA (DUF1232 family)
MANQDCDFYQTLRNKFKDWQQTDAGQKHKYAEFLMFAPDLFHLMCKLSIDPDVSVKDKAKLAGAIAYFVSPIDLVPEGLVGPIGYIDDIAIAAYVLNGIINNTDPEVLKKHWAGEGDVLENIKNILKVADEMVGSGLWKKLKGMFK